MSTHTPTLSVVVNNYNYAQFLSAALDSVLPQLATADELIVVDDGSTDQSPALLQRYATEHGITIITQANSGQLQAVCQGLDAATKEVVVLLDSDDIFIPGYLDRLRTIYSEHPGVDCVFTRPQPFGEDDPAVTATVTNLNNMALRDGPVGSTRWASRLFQEYVGVPTSGNSLRRALAQDVLPLLRRLNEPLTLSPWLARLVGVSATETNRPGQSADGALVRCTSLLGAHKYYDSNYGFRYRIHASNKYANSSGMARRYLRGLRKQQFARFANAQPELGRRATTRELLEEVEQRALPMSAVRRRLTQLLYCRALLGSRGKPMEKASALSQIMRR
ncbi:MAG: glycosyltransferase involved in cell wall biosynthesis [Bacteroidia bacterium]|jgi:glycosyltransferase involved in cell wall biosynthesis